jgi:hypothetical protein
LDLLGRIQKPIDDAEQWLKDSGNPFVRGLGGLLAGMQWAFPEGRAGKLGKEAKCLKVAASAAEKAKLAGAARDTDYFVGIVDKAGNIKLFKAGENGITAHDNLVEQGLAKLGEDLGFSVGLDANGAVQVSNMSQLNAPLGLGGQLPPAIYSAVKQALGGK